MTTISVNSIKTRRANTRVVQGNLPIEILAGLGTREAWAYRTVGAPGRFDLAYGIAGAVMLGLALIVGAIKMGVV
jgi:hypothetical protein